jgi:peptidoglycan glycosyltransferase
LHSDPRFRFGRRRPNRRRRHGVRLTPAGRIGLALLALAVLGVGWGGRVAFRAWEDGPSFSLPAVSTPPPLAGVASAWIEDPPRSRKRFDLAREQAEKVDPSSAPRLVEWLEPTGRASFYRFGAPGPSVAEDSSGGAPFRIEYSLDEKLTEEIFEILRRGRVERGEVIVLDPRSGRLLAYISTDPQALPPERAYPAASIVKILTAATLMEEAPGEAKASCVYQGNKYRLNYRRLSRPKSGHQTTLERALATSNNQCFSQWAVHVLGEEKLHSTFERFGWLAPPAPGHEAGQVEAASTKLQLGRLGSGLDGTLINPLHVATLASILTDGRWVEPWWVDRIVDSHGRSLEAPERRPARRVLSKEVADRLRSMLVATTKMGTAKRAFRSRRGRPLIPGIDVAGKTGNLTAGEPFGRYEWFLGLAPAESPTVAVVVLQVQSNLWWSRSTELAAKILREVFCDSKGCLSTLANRWTGDLGEWTDPLLISELEGQSLHSRTDGGIRSSSGSETASNAARANPL